MRMRYLFRYLFLPGPCVCRFRDVTAPAIAIGDCGRKGTKKEKKTSVTSAILVSVLLAFLHVIIGFYLPLPFVSIGSQSHYCPLAAVFSSLFFLCGGGGYFLFLFSTTAFLPSFITTNPSLSMTFRKCSIKDAPEPGKNTVNSNPALTCQRGSSANPRLLMEETDSSSIQKKTTKQLAANDVDGFTGFFISTGAVCEE